MVHLLYKQKGEVSFSGEEKGLTSTDCLHGV
ncbi:hypothetical protein ABAC460_06205 [Asticcacaulis sp. AC460]|nr:hypothetical protein ABAC460_06205 [Asticcacaulis sp. AC460]